jgi:hypothetical protein
MRKYQINVPVRRVDYNLKNKKLNDIIQQDGVKLRSVSPLCSTHIATKKSMMTQHGQQTVAYCGQDVTQKFCL